MFEKRRRIAQFLVFAAVVGSIASPDIIGVALLIAAVVLVAFAPLYATPLICILLDKNAGIKAKHTHLSFIITAALTIISVKIGDDYQVATHLFVVFSPFVLIAYRRSVKSNPRFATALWFASPLLYLGLSLLPTEFMVAMPLGLFVLAAMFYKLRVPFAHLVFVLGVLATVAVYHYQPFADHTLALLLLWTLLLIPIVVLAHYDPKGNPISATARTI